jgi:hypothetical protein
MASTPMPDIMTARNQIVSADVTIFQIYFFHGRNCFHFSITAKQRSVILNSSSDSSIADILLMTLPIFVF